MCSIIFAQNGIVGIVGGEALGNNPHTGVRERRDMGEFEFEVDWETLSREGIWHSIGQELAERGIHKNRFSDYSVKVLVTVYYDIKRGENMEIPICPFCNKPQNIPDKIEAGYAICPICKQKRMPQLERRQ